MPPTCRHTPRSHLPQGAPTLNTVLGVACAQIARDRQAIATMQADQAVAAAKAHTPAAAFKNK